MNIYFFSHHTQDPKMIEDLGCPITAQFKGTISDIHSKDSQISFTETMYIGGQTIKCCHSIPASSIAIVEGSLLLQDAWLKAGIGTLLIPQMSQEMSREKHSFQYYGLLQIHRIEVITSKWTNTNPTNTENVEESANLASDAVGGCLQHRTTTA